MLELILLVIVLYVIKFLYRKMVIKNNKKEEECVYKLLELEQTYVARNIKNVLLIISLFPFQYRKHPFIYKFRYGVHDHFVFLAKELKPESKSYLSIKSVKNVGFKVLIEWNHSSKEQGKTILVRKKVFTYCLIFFENMPFQGKEVETIRLSDELE